MTTKKNESALLEIGVEELPARFIDPALEQLKILGTKILGQRGLTFSSLQVWGSPRRLTLFIGELSSKSNDKQEIFLGPPVAAAKDVQGKWTQAATGFAKSHNVSVESLSIQQSPKGERYGVTKEVKGQKADLLLPEIFLELIKGINFPKNMVWEPSRFKFARPIRWLMGLHGKKVIRFNIAGVRSDRFTMGLMALGGNRLSVPTPEKYKSLLQGRCLLIDPDDRQKKIEDQLDVLAKKVKGRAIAEGDHIREVVHITEYPVSLTGRFEEKYLKLPREVIVTVLRKHQKFFPIENSKGDLLPYFIGVRNGPSDSQETVKEGYERVTAARLSDAHFFFDKDLAIPLADLAPRLVEVGFHEKLGNLHDKTLRVRSLVSNLGKKFSFNEELLTQADRTAMIAKADLLTQMVGELPELQGIAGRFYGLRQEDPQVAHAIEEHYWPLTAQGALPQSPLSSLVAVADKMDTLAANFSVGLIPSGSADPYGLRRAAIGIIRILLEQKWDISFELLIDMAVENLGALIQTDKTKVKNDLLHFFQQRFSSFFEGQGFRPDEIDTILSGPVENIFYKANKLKALQFICERPEFISLTGAIKRARNILIQAEQKGFLDGQPVTDMNNFIDPSEKKLSEALRLIKPQLEDSLANLRYEEALVSLSTLKDPVDQFFNGVKVMVDEADVRQKRLILIKQVKNLFDQFADFSKLQGTSLS